MVFYGYRIQVDRFSISPASWFLVRILKKKENAGAFFVKPSNIALKVYQITYKHSQILKLARTTWRE
jgi:hypothetical protein